jgi:hypothetical protein
MNSLTDGTVFDNFTDEELAVWLLASARENAVPGNDNLVLSMRQAAFRLAPQLFPNGVGVSDG